MEVRSLEDCKKYSNWWCCGARYVEIPESCCHIQKTFDDYPVCKVCQRPTSLICFLFNCTSSKDSWIKLDKTHNLTIPPSKRLLNKSTWRIKGSKKLLQYSPNLNSPTYITHGQHGGHCKNPQMTPTSFTRIHSLDKSSHAILVLMIRRLGWISLLQKSLF